MFFMRKRPEPKGTYALKKWETALLMALCLFFLSGLLSCRTQRDLAGGLVRLHVIANSDSRADQAAKLQMRDRVLAVLSPALEGCASREDAVDIIQEHIPDLEALGDVAVTLGTERYPTRDYDTFSLPAGEYLSLRVVMGAGQGRNWWCVVFPPLCTEALAEPAEDVFQALPGDSAGLITRESGYVIRFRLVEWWNDLAQWLDDTLKNY